MNDTQWLFELEGLYAKEEDRYEELRAISKFIKQSVVEMLGLNLMPIEEEIPFEERDPELEGAIGGDSAIRRLRAPNENEIIPLSILMGREEIIAEIIKRQQELHTQEELDSKLEKGDLVQMTPDELEEFMFEDRDDGDIAFLDDPELFEKRARWNSEEMQRMNSLLVKPMEDKDKDVDFMEESPPKPSRKRSKVTLK